MSFKKFLIEKEDEELATVENDVVEKINDFLKSTEKDDINAESIESLANDLDMDTSELQLKIYQLYKDKLDSEEDENDEHEVPEEDETDSEEHEDLETPEEEDDEHKQVKAKKTKSPIMLDDSEVIKSFYKKEPMSGNKLKCTGTELQHVGENVTCIAKWKGSKFTVLEGYKSVEISKYVKRLRENCSYTK